MFFIIVFILYGGLNVFIAKTLYHYISLFIQFKPIIFYIIYTLLACTMLTTIIPVSFPFKSILSTIGAYWMGIFAYLLIFILLSKLFGRFFNESIIAILVCVLTLSTCMYGFIHVKSVDIKEYTVDLVEGDFNMVLISDIHLGAISSTTQFEKTVDNINKLDADIVVIAGDIFDNDYTKIKDVDKSLELFHSIKSKYGIYACFGNHDAGESYDDMVAFLDKANVKLLRDEYTIIDDKFVLAGRNDPTPIGKGLKRTESTKFIKNIDSDLPIIVLDHNPQCIKEYNEDVDLLLCGHTHKGQIFPIEFITNSMFECDYGYYKKDNGPHVIVTSGSGYWGMPMRVGSSCEVVSITL